MLGAGVELWMGAHAVARLSMLDRIRILPSSDTNLVHHEPTVIYELVYRP